MQAIIKADLISQHKAAVTVTSKSSLSYCHFQLEVITEFLSTE